MADDNVVASVKIKVSPDTSKFAKELSVKIKADIEKVESNAPAITIKAELDSNDLSEKVKAVVGKAEKEAGKLEIKVDLDDTASLDRGIAQIKAELETLRSQTITVDLDKGALELQLAELENRRRTIEFQAVLKTNAATQLAKLTGFRLGFSMFQHFTDFLNNIDKKVPIIGSMALAIAGLAGASIAAAGDIFSLSRALAQIGPGALALPGLIGGIGVGLLATAVVMKDFNKEFSDLAVGYGRNLKAGAAWQKLQNQMSDVFWKKVHAPMQALIQTVFPQIRTGLLGTSDALGTFFTNLSDSLNKEFKGGALTRMFNSLNKSIRVFSSHTDSIASLVRIFGELGTRQLPSLADWFGKVLDKFNAFMKTAERTGDLDKWIATAVERMKELGRVVVAVGKIFYGLAKAADAADGKTGNALDSLATGLEKVAKFVNSSAIQERLTGVFSAAHEMMDRISQKSGPAFAKYWDNTSQTLLKLLPRAGDAVGDFFGALFDFLGDPALQKGQLSLFDGLAKGLENVRPVMHDIAVKSGEMLTIIGDLAELFGKVFASKIHLLMPIMTAFLKVLDLIVKALLLVPDPIWQVVAAFVALKKAQSIWMSFGPQLTSTFTGMRGGFAQVKSDIGLVATTMMTAGATTEREATRMKGAMDRLRVSMAGLKGAVTTLAGVGGLMLLSKGFSETSDKAKGFGTTLDKTLGGALTGLAVGGPIGAAVGGVAGLASGFHDLQLGFAKALGVEDEFTTTTYDSKAVIDKYRESVQTLRDTLDQLTGSITANTRTQALADFKKAYGDIDTVLHQLGVTDRQIASAVTGDKGAYRQIIGLAQRAGIQLPIPLHSIEDALGDIGLRTDTAVKKMRNQIKVGQDLSALYGKLPKKVVSKIEQTGIQPTLRGVAKVAAKYDTIDKRQVKALIKASGTDFTVKQVQQVIRTLQETSRTKGDVKTWHKGVKSDLDQTVDDSKRSAKWVKDALTQPLEQVRPDLHNYLTGLNTGLTTAKGSAKRGGTEVGNYLVSGVVSATYAGGGPLSAAAGSIISQALAEMRRRAKIHSPSRETMAIGNYMGQGLVIGLGKQKGNLLATAKSLVGMLLKGLSSKEGAAFKKRLNTITSLIPKSLSDEKRKELQKALAPEQKDLQKALGQWQSVVNKIKAKIKSIYQGADQLKQQVLNSVIALGDPTQLEGDVTFDAITTNMADAIDKAKRFATVLRQLKKLGLNNETFMQLVNAGPEAALASAEAIAQAGQSGVDALNDQQKELDKYAKQAAKIARKQYIDNGMAMAEGMLKGLRDKRKELEQEMDKIAQSMVKTIKKALGIHSPSRVFRKLGNHTGTGFVLGVKDMHKKAEAAMTKLVAFSPEPVRGFGSVEGSYGPQTVSNRTVNYYAAPGQSLNSEEALFAALTRARSEGF